MSVRSVLTKKHYMGEIVSSCLGRVFGPKKRSTARINSLTGAGRVKSTEGVEILEMEVWTEDRTPCREHKYDPLKSKPGKEITSLLAGGYRVKDYICVRCRHGKRKISKV